MSADQKAGTDVKMDEADYEEFKAMCREEGVECEVVRGLAEDVITVLGVAPLAYESVRYVAVRISGSGTKVAALDRFVDRKKGAHVIYTDASGELVDGRCKTIGYGKVCVHEPRRQLDIDATPLIVDANSRTELANKIKKSVKEKELHEVCEIVRSWEGIRQAELLLRGVTRRIAGGPAEA